MRSERDIFKKRVNYKPFEYPEVLQFVDAINKSFWVHSEVDFTADIQDFRAHLTPIEQEVVKRSLLSIAQIEVGVKTFWGNLYNIMPKPELNGLGSTFAECHIDGTEVLTTEGWMDIKNVTNRNLVASFDENLKIIFDCPLNIISKHVDNGLHHLSGKDHSAFITPGHRIALFENGNKEMTFKESKDVSYNNSSLRFPVSSGVPLDEMSYNKFLKPIERLRIAIQADGHKRFYVNVDNEKKLRGASKGKVEYDLTFTKERKKERLESILNELGDEVEYKVNTTPLGVTTYTIYMDDKYDYKSFDWVLDEIHFNETDWYRGFISELPYWDGTYLENKKNCKIKYSTTDKNNADIAQLVGTLAGYKSNLIVSIDNRSDSYSDVYIVSFNKNRETLPITSLTKKDVEYNGIVRCLTMPKGTLITRYKNKVFWSGNCEFRHSEAYSRLLEVLGYNDEFTKLVEIPIFKKRLEYMEHNLSNSDIFSKLVFFTIVIENASLFSQFANILSFTRFKGYMKNVSNIIAWTSIDEQTHANAGIYLINKMKEEGHILNYESLSKTLIDYVQEESQLLDWIYETGELDFFSKENMLNFMKYRIDEVLVKLGFNKLFNISYEQYKPMAWFEEEVFANELDDFFAKRPTAYTKHDKPITKNDLF